MTDKVDIWMPLYVRDYLGATSRLTTEQHGAYMLLIMDYWLNGPPPDDDAVLAQITRMPIDRWQAGVRQALSRHFKIESHQWVHPRIEGEKEKASNKRRRSVAGAAGKWGEGGAAEKGRKTRSQRLAEARKKGTHTDEQWEAMKAFHGNACVRCEAAGDLVKDHITPIYQGGSDGIENIQPLCKKCNSSKGPEDKDFRLNGWQNACQTPAKRLPNACPSPSPSPSPTSTPGPASSKSKDQEPDGSSSAPEQPPPEAKYVIPLTAGKQHPVTQEDIDKYRELFPAVDIEQSIRNMLAWLDSNPQKRSGSARGAKTRMTSWLSRDQDKASRQPGGSQAGQGSAAQAAIEYRRNRQRTIEGGSNGGQ